MTEREGVLLIIFICLMHCRLHRCCSSPKLTHIHWNLWATVFERRGVIRDVNIPAGPDEDTISSAVKRSVNNGEYFNFRVLTQ